MITLENNVLDIRCPDVHPDARTRLEFQRTLRIPDDKKVHALPAGLGCFPIRHVEDFSAKLDEVTLRRGGVMMPMHRSEAMWINFRDGKRRPSAPAYPFAIKVAAGKVNALTGGAWSPALSAEEQDYVVVPEQPWIDGFAISKGIIRQFIAERLGEGFSAEEQLTGKAEFGGLQIIAYPMKAERYMDIFGARAREEAEQRAKELGYIIKWSSSFPGHAQAGTALCMATLEKYERALRALTEAGLSSNPPDLEEIAPQIRELHDLQAQWVAQVKELARFAERSQPKARIESDERPSFLRRDSSPSKRSMGLGGGGQMRQDIYPDPYGVDAWDQSAASRCFVHLIDAAQWADISGSPAPTEPPSQQDYSNRGLPWFDYYAPEKGAISGSKLLAGLKSWGSIYGKGPGAAAAKAGQPIQLGTVARGSGVVSEGAGDE